MASKVRGTIVDMCWVNGVLAIHCIASYNASEDDIDQRTRAIALASLADETVSTSNAARSQMKHLNYTMPE